MTLHQLYLYCRENGYPEEAEHLDHYLRLQGYVSPVGRAAPIDMDAFMRHALKDRFPPDMERLVEESWQ